MATYEFVGVGKQTLGVPGSNTTTEGWCFTYQKDDGDFHHHIMPKHTFASAAEEYGLDLDDDWEEVFDIVMHEPLVPDSALIGVTELPEPAVMKSRAGAPKLNSLGRRMKQRADFAKQLHEVVGLEVASERVRPERWAGRENIEARLARLEAVRQGRNIDPRTGRGGPAEQSAD